MDAFMLKLIEVYEADGSRYYYYTKEYQHLDELLMDVEKHHFFDHDEILKAFSSMNPFVETILIDAQVLRETFKKAKEPVTREKKYGYGRPAMKGNDHVRTCRVRTRHAKRKGVRSAN